MLSARLLFALFIGLAMSHVVKVPVAATLPPGVIQYDLGEPLLFKMASWMIWGLAACASALIGRLAGQPFGGIILYTLDELLGASRWRRV